MANSSKKYRYNPDPRLSANQLAEYLKATPPRRKAIVKEAKFPKTSVVAQYKGAREGISRYICSPERDPSILTSTLLSLAEKEARESATPWTKDDARRSAEAIETFRKSLNALGVDKLDCRPVAGSQPNIQIGGVEISVNLDATTHRLVKGVDRVGGVILMFSKASETSGTKRAERCKVSAVLALLFAKEHLGYLGEPDQALCYSLDVLQGRAYPAPNSYKTMLGHMQDSCEEIGLRWPGTPPPPDYDGPAWD
jgi:hypothetical protein